MGDQFVIYERKSGWSAFDLRGLWNYHELPLFVTWRDILVCYKQAVLGVAWAIPQPLLTMVVFAGLLPWQLRVFADVV